MLVTGYGKQQNLAMIEKLLLNLKIKSIPVDIVLMNAAMDALIEADSPLSAIQIFRYMSEVCNMVSRPVNSLKYRRTDSISENEFQSTKPSFEINQNISSKIDYILDKSFGLDIKRYIHSYEGEKDLRPNVRTFNTLLKALRNAGYPGYQASLKIIDLMTKVKLDLDTISLNTLVDICSINGNTDLAQVVCINNSIYSS